MKNSILIIMSLVLLAGCGKDPAPVPAAPAEKPEVQAPEQALPSATLSTMGKVVAVRFADLSFDAALPILMGVCIGAAVPVVLSAIGARAQARRAAAVYPVASVLGVAVCSVLFYGAN